MSSVYHHEWTNSSSTRTCLPGVVGDGRLVLERLVPGVGVDHLHGVAAVLVVEVVVDALLLHETAHEVEVGLAVLNAVLARSVLADQVELGGRYRRVVGEDLLDDVGNGLFLEDPAVRRASEEPQPRPHGHAVFVVAADHAPLREARDIAVEVTVTTVPQLQLHRDGLAEQVARVDVAVGRQCRQVELGRPRHLLAPT